MTFGDLCNYYLECLKKDEIDVSLRPGCFIILDMGYGIKEEIILTDSIEKFINERNAFNLNVGYPCYINSKGEYIPIFIFSISTDKNRLKVDLSSSILNIKKLIDEGLLYDEFDYSSISNPYPSDLSFHNLHSILNDVIKSVRWIDSEDSATISGSIYNTSILFSDRRISSYTRGLCSELKSLSKKDTSSLSGTALEKLVFIDKIANEINSDISNIYQVSTLNEEQQKSIRDSFSHKISVITGPPGTGKSQVITNFVVNAVINKKRVLIVSKNNKAIDIVEQRVNALTEMPTVLRLGNNRYASRLEEYITHLLSNEANFGEISKELRRTKILFDKAIAKHATISNQIHDLIRQRNIVDSLEIEVHSLRESAPKLFKQIKHLDVDNLYIKLQKCNFIIESIDKDWTRIWNKLFWRVCKNKITRTNTIQISSIRRLCRNIGINFNSKYSLYKREHIQYYKSIVKQVDNKIKLIEKVKVYYEALEDLLKLPSLEHLYGQKEANHNEIIKQSNAYWKLYVKQISIVEQTKEREQISNLLAKIKRAIASNSFKPFNADDLENIKRYIPCWAVSSLSAKGKIPLQANFFDYVVFDESSQCDIASAIPLLYRAKSAVIVGDPMQLTHISKLPLRENDELRCKYGLDDKKMRFSYIENSLYDCALPAVKKPHALLNHYRCHPDIIQFSNTRFYNNILRCATNPKFLEHFQEKEPGIIWKHVEGTTEKPKEGSAYNKEEAKRVAFEVERLVCKDRFQGTIGVVTPFRKQANYIRCLVETNKNIQGCISFNRIIIETSHRFQGDEKDIIIMSPVVSIGMFATAARFLNNQENLFNVAITRARSMLIIIGNLHYCLSENTVPFLHDLAHYSQELASNPLRIYSFLPKSELSSSLELYFFAALHKAGITNALPQYTRYWYILDFAIILDDGRKLDIEIDGKHYHSEWNENRIHEDLIRDEVLTSDGWTIMRFWAYEVLDNTDECVKQVQNWLHNESYLSSQN